MANASTIGQAIAEARKAAGMATQGELAARVGLSAGMISRYETDKARPDDQGLADIEHALGVPRGWVLVRAGLVDVEPVREAQAKDVISLRGLSQKHRGILMFLAQELRSE